MSGKLKRDTIVLGILFLILAFTLGSGIDTITGLVDDLPKLLGIIFLFRIWQDLKPFGMTKLR